MRLVTRQVTLASVAVAAVLADWELIPTSAGAASGSAAAQTCSHPVFGNPEFDVADAPTSVAVGDLDGDLDLDLAVANTDSDDVSVLLNNGNGTFATHVTYGVGNGPRSVAVGDLDGDLDLDLAVANRNSDDVSVLLNNCEQDPCPADLNGDGTVGVADLLQLFANWGPCEQRP